MASTLRARIRRIWATVGSVVFVGFVLWCAIAYRPASGAADSLKSGADVTVAEGDGWWRFMSASVTEPRVNLVFLSGAMVDPIAYAPLMRAIAAKGYPVYLMALPSRGAFGRADGDDFLNSIRAFTDSIPGAWVVAGHSRGGKIASMIAREPTARMTALVIVGSTHPRDFSLAGSRLAVTKIYGSNDGVAPELKVMENKALLPAATRWVRVEGGNHNQFGYYGFQPGDSRATITRAEQQAQTEAAMLSALDAARRSVTPDR